MPEGLLPGSFPFLNTLPVPNDSKELIPSFKKRAWDRFLELGLPTGKEEAFRSVFLRTLYAREVLGEAAPSFEPIELGSKGLFLSLEEAASRFPFVVKDRCEKFLATEKNPFALLSFALSRGSAFLYLPPGQILEAPLDLTLKSEAFSCPYLLVALGKGSSMSLSLTRKSSHLSFGLLDASLDEGSRLHLTEIDDGAPDGISFHSIRGELKRNSHLLGLHYTKGGKMALHHKKMTLAGVGAEADLSGLWSLKGAMTAQMWIEMIHQEPQARSRQRFKGALYDQSTSYFYGEIYVHDKAQGTDAYQLNQNLLLGDEVRSEARPNLQIFADDVKASHGSTAGGLQPEELFYLKTRGLSETLARELLIRAFVNDILSLHPEAARRKEIASWLS